MLALVLACLVRGLEGRLVEVQVDVSPAGIPGFTIVGLASGSLREARERVRAALRNSGLPFPQRRLTVNLAPAELRKDGSGLDLAIAVAVGLAALGRPSPPGAAFLGELGLDGSLRHVDGVLVAARALGAMGIRELFVPEADAAEAALADGVSVRPSPHLSAVFAHLQGAELIAAHVPPPRAALRAPAADALAGDDLAGVHGQEGARRALEVAAAGGHHLLLTGPPGTGKTMLARCLPGLLPPLSIEEALEVAQIRSVLGELPPGGPLDWARPFRSPHHSISAAGLVGGGARLASPGEISLAHHGVLFLDELAEFQPATLQALRQPIELGRVVLRRSGGPVTYPSRFQLVGATNPCPCGFAGDGRRECRCTPAAIDAYRRGLSGPLLDRVDLQVAVARTPLRQLARGLPGEPTTVIRARVAQARQLQLERQGGLNSELTGPQLLRYGVLAAPAREALERWAEDRGLSARAFHRAWRVARTLADLAGDSTVGEHQVMEAFGYRLERAA